MIIEDAAGRRVAFVVDSAVARALQRVREVAAFAFRIGRLGDVDRTAVGNRHCATDIGKHGVFVVSLIRISGNRAGYDVGNIEATLQTTEDRRRQVYRAFAAGAVNVQRSKSIAVCRQVQASVKTIHTESS